MKFSDFVTYVKNVGGVDTDGYYGKQCMDLYNFYCNNVLNIYDCGADCAKNIIKNNNIMKNVKRIDNYPEFIPQKGDIAVWLGGTYGHVAICLGEGDLNAFKSLDQNWKAQQLTEEWHNYTYLNPLVFLRPYDQTNIFEEYVVRCDKTEANVRRAPSTNSEIVPQLGNPCLYKGDTFIATEKVTGEMINNNNIWFKSKKGNYVWSGGMTIL